MNLILLRKAVEVVVAGDTVSVTSVVTEIFSVGGRVWHSSTCVGLLQVAGLVVLVCAVMAFGSCAAGIVGWIASLSWTRFRR